MRNRYKMLLMGVAASLLLSGCIAQPKSPSRVNKSTDLSNRELAEAVAYLIEERNKTEYTENNTGSDMIGLTCSSGNMTEQAQQDRFLSLVESVDNRYLEITTRHDQRIKELESELEKLKVSLVKELEADKNIPDTAIELNSTRSVTKNKATHTPAKQLGNSICTTQSDACYVAVAAVNVRKNPCVGHPQCTVMRVKTYGELVYVLDEVIGQNGGKWFKVSDGGYIRDYTLRELDPDMPEKTILLNETTNIVSNPFNGNVLGTFNAGDNVQVSGCAFGWCKLYKQAGYINFNKDKQ